jgi:hypothetical protein
LATRFSACAAVLLAVVGVACSSARQDKPCPPYQPAFRIQLTAVDGALPADTHLTVGYNGIEEESYSLAKGGPGNEDVCCRPGSPVRGALPDVKCGLPLPMDASIPRHDAATHHDAAVSHDAAVLHDAAISQPDGAGPNDAAARRDGSSSLGADAAQGLPVLRDAAVQSTDTSVHDASWRDPSMAPDDPTGPTAILCELWTGGRADIVVTGTGYPKLDVQFDAFVPEPRCGVVTVDQRIVLSHGDGGKL